VIYWFHGTDFGCLRTCEFIAEQHSHITNYPIVSFCNSTLRCMMEIPFNGRNSFIHFSIRVLTMCWIRIRNYDLRPPSGFSHHLHCISRWQCVATTGIAPRSTTRITYRIQYHTLQQSVIVTLIPYFDHHPHHRYLLRLRLCQSNRPCSKSLAIIFGCCFELLALVFVLIYAPPLKVKLISLLQWHEILSIFLF
jgi:hypothetical protein